MSYGMDGWCRREESTMGQVGIEGQSTEDSIRRQTVLDAIDEIEKEVSEGEGFQYEKWRKYLCDLPSAQPERKKGRWSGARCSVCGVSRYNFINILHTNAGYRGTWKYCPNCGAEMEVNE